MCGRYFIDDKTYQEISRLIRYTDKRPAALPVGDIFPSSRAPVLISHNAEFSAELCIWGFPSFDRKKLIINARSETAFEKRSFRDSIANRRCAVPVAGFYEWNSKKEKYTFTRKDGNIFYLAGFYKEFDGIWRFVILTCEANISMREVHSRMPLILKKEELSDWLCDNSLTEYFLKKIPPALAKQTEYEQQTLNFSDF